MKKVTAKKLGSIALFTVLAVSAAVLMGTTPEKPRSTDLSVTAQKLINESSAVVKNHTMRLSSIQAAAIIRANAVSE